MVKGVDNNGENVIKLKGLKQNIDLGKLEGLRQTKQNKSVFKKFDKNQNGILDQMEAGDMSKWLADAAGNKTLSQREMKKAGGDETMFTSLSSLSEQQRTLAEGKEYVETNSNTTTHILSDKNEVIRYDKITEENGNITTTFENGDTIIQDKNGNKLSTVIKQGGKEVKTEFEYDGNKKIARETVDGQLRSITVNENKDGHEVETKYSSQEDYDNNRPSEEITDAQNPTLKKTTKFTYDDKGNVKAETTDSAGQVTTTYKDSEGNEIKAEDFDKQKPATTQPEVAGTHTVTKGEGINKIVRDALKEQGIENPTKEQLQKAREEFLEMNKDLVKTYHGVKKEWHGNKFFYVDDVVQIPKFSVAAATTEEAEDPATQTTPTPQETVPTLKEQLQQRLGSDYIVEEGEGGKVVIKDMDGDLLPELTVISNNPNLTVEKDGNGTIIVKDKNGNTLKSASDMANLPSDKKIADKIIEEADVDINNTISKDEFKNYILAGLEAMGVTIDDTNRTAIETAIETGFTNIDSINTDSNLTKDELIAKAREIIIKQLPDTIENILSKTEQLDLGE